MDYNQLMYKENNNYKRRGPRWVLKHVVQKQFQTKSKCVSVTSW